MVLVGQRLVAFFVWSSFFFFVRLEVSYLPAGTAMRRPVRDIPGGLLSLIKAIL